MCKHLFTAMLALAAIPGLAPGGDNSTKPPTTLPIPASQPAAPPSPAGELGAPRLDGVPDGKSGPDAGGPWSLADGPCGPPSCFWLRAEYLLWWTKDTQLPALVTSGVPGATALPGVLGQPGTTVLFGNSEVDDEMRTGGRFSGGIWLNNCQSIGLEGSYFFLGSRSVHFDDSSTLIARPFFDVMSGIENAQLVAFPGIATGQLHLVTSNSLQGADLNLLCIPCCTPACDTCADESCRSGDTPKYKSYCDTCCGCNYWVSLLGGFRYLQMDEDLAITESSQVNPALAAGSPLFGGSTINIADQFDTHNYFYGAQVGAQAEICWGRLFVDVMGKVAVGETHEVVDIHGSTAITSPTGTTVVTPAGFLASGSNSGHFSRDVFAVVPEFGLNAGFQITHNLRATVGYTFLYWSSVVRAADQVDVGLSGTQIPTDTRFNPQAGPSRPAVALRDTDFWAQGVSFGLEFRY